MITQEEALKRANELFKQHSPHAVIYGYHVKRNINAKEVHEYLERPIVCKTKDELKILVNNYLSKESVTREFPSKITGFDVLYHELYEGLKTRTLWTVDKK